MTIADVLTRSRPQPATASLYGISALVVALFLAGCGGASSGDDSGNAGADGAGTDTTAIPVEIRVARRGEIFAAYPGTATLEAFQEATVVAKVEGQVEEILVEEGDTVTAGQVLARLDGDRLRLRLQEARANLAKAEREYRRNVELHEKGLVASGAYENVKYELDALQAAFDSAELEYSYAEIRAPIDGVVAERLIKVGNTIPVSTPCFHIADLQPLVAYLYVPEREFGKMAPGQAVDIRVDALGDERYRATVARISPLVDAATGTFKVTIEMKPDDTALKPGMFARVSVIYDERPDALLVPRIALTESETGSTIYVVAGDEARRRSVETGYGWGDELEILSGIAEGDKVVIVGQKGLKDGTSVEVVGDDGDDESTEPTGAVAEAEDPADEQELASSL